MGYMTDGLSFNTLRIVNEKRLPIFKNKRGGYAHSKPDGSDWSKAQWLQAVLGELGELANIMKKVDRGDFTEEEALEDIQKEFADIIIYMDIFAKQYSIDLGRAVAQKFNEVSHRVKAPVFITQDLSDWTIHPESACPHHP